MGELSYSRKHRPLVIEDYIGDMIKKTVANNYYNTTSPPQSVLVYGTLGCGKTTIARLLAKEYLCVNKVNGRACGVCDMCVEIDENLIMSDATGVCTGVREINAATSNTKELIDGIIEEAMEQPMGMLKYNVLIFDECHKISTAAQNSLLKIVEEPPPHLVIILCTTDPENMLATLKSRCRPKIRVKKPSIKELAARLLEVAKVEGLTVSKEALELITKYERIPREALNLLEDVAKENNKIVSVENVLKSVNIVSSELYIEYFKAANTSLEKIVEFNKKLRDTDADIKDFTKGLTRFVIDSMQIKMGLGIEEISKEYVKKIKELFDIYNSREFDILLQIIEYMNRMVGQDEVKSELVLINTAIKISKIELLLSDKGLADNDITIAKENKKSYEIYKKDLEEETHKHDYDDGEEIDSSALQKLFGGTMRTVSNNATVEIATVTDVAEVKEENSNFSAEELEMLAGI